MKTLKLILIVVLVSTILLAGCQPKEPEATPTPAVTPQESPPEETPGETPKAELELPEQIDNGSDSTITVYLIDEEKNQEMPLNEYLYGVVAGEVKKDWPEEVLKAQAIMARTFMLEFLMNKESQYEGADISTDVTESQAYNAGAVNDAIKKAVDDTKGQVIIFDNNFIKAWFHSCSGGKTATATEGLEIKENPPYIQSVESDESAAPEDVQTWSKEFNKDKLDAALADMEEDISDYDTIEMGEKGESGRCLTLKFGDAEVSCVQLRMALAASEFRSTLLDEVKFENGVLSVKGKGFGHGVGVSQWGAYKMAEDGKSAEEIITYYYKDVELAQAWE